MSTLSADTPLSYDALSVPQRDNHMVWLAFAVSALLHAAAVALLPGMRVPEPKSEVLTVQLLTPPPPPEAQRKVVPKKPPIKQPKVEKAFERQDLEATAAPAPVPEPKPLDPRPEVAPAPRVEPTIAQPSIVPEPVPVMRAEPRTLPDLQPPTQQQIERPPVASAPSRPEPMIERRAEARPEARLEAAVQPRPQVPEPRPTPKVEQRVEPVA